MYRILDSEEKKENENIWTYLNFSSELNELLIFFIVKTLQGFLFPPAHMIKMIYEFHNLRKDWGKLFLLREY